MPRPLFSGLDKTRLRGWLLLFFLALAIPTAILIRHAYSELRWEAFHNHRVLAEELATRIDSGIQQLIDTEEERPFTDFSFLNIAGDPSANFLQRSTLSTYPVATAIPGLIGYFQIDAQGLFSTPLLPQQRRHSSSDYGIPADERQQREALAGRIRQILSQNRLVQSKGGRKESEERKELKGYELQDQQRSSAAAMSEYPARDSAAQVPYQKYRIEMEEAMITQQAFDQLKKRDVLRENKQKTETAGRLGRIKDLKLDDRFQSGEREAEQSRSKFSSAPAPKKRQRKREQSVLPEADKSILSEETIRASRPDSIRIRTFESELDPFEFSLLDSGHFVIFRKVWRNGQRYIQGMLVEQQPFLDGLVKSVFSDTGLSQMSDLILAYQGDLLSIFHGLASREYLSSAEELTGSLLYQRALSAPLNDFDLIFSIRHLPAGPGAAVTTWIAVIMIIVLCGGFYLMYRLGLRQIALARQQQDFVSAVSHELKTPLTSIRMYGEMLLEGWVSEEKRVRYYRYIHDESERLSRLIKNVLQLARMTRNEIQLDLNRISTKDLIEEIRAKIASPVERAGFELELKLDADAGAYMDVGTSSNACLHGRKVVEQRRSSCRGADAGAYMDVGTSSNAGAVAGDTLVEVDIDCFTQILINLVDNAIKFAAKADKKLIEIGCARQKDDRVLFTVRDYGPGVQRAQMKKIFKLFYRSENELTRETLGTGIGLALVHQLTQEMKGRVDVINREPGAEFRLTFPVAADSDVVEEIK